MTEPTEESLFVFDPEVEVLELELRLRKPELDRALEVLKAAEHLDQAVLDLVIDI